MSYSNQRYQGYPYVNPIVTDAPSIDPASASRWTNLPRRAITPSIQRPGTSGTSKINETSSSGSRPPAPTSPDEDDDTPVLYIDVPEPNGSDVCTSIESITETQPEFVQDTILYDPFENTRIDVPKDDASSHASSDTHSQGPSTPGTSAQRPNHLNLAGRSNSIQGSNTPTSGLPSFLQKESYVYGGHGSDGFPLSPIPVSDFPEPPPAYTEVDLVTRPAPTPVPQEPQQPSEPQRPPEPQRTQVIISTPDSARSVGIMRYDCKNLSCHHCGCRVHTLVIKQNGYMTYIIALLLFIFVMPMLLALCFTDYFKHKNHYCPNCHKLIGYQLPVCGEQINLVV